MMSLVSLVYVSYAADSTTEHDIKNILQTARDFNGRNNITGMLLYREPYYIQTLEGEKAVVDALYEKICRDPRHTNIVLVFENDIKKRSFAQWSMGFNKITDEDIQAAGNLNDFLAGERDISFFTLRPSRATALLEAFKDRTFY